MAEATLTELLDELTVFEAPVAKRESTDSALAFKAVSYTHLTLPTKRIV